MNSARAIQVRPIIEAANATMPVAMTRPKLAGDKSAKALRQPTIPVIIRFL